MSGPAVAVMGAGAVGCYYGGMLARAGHPVTLVARAPHVEAIRREGLRMQTTQFDERVRLAASTEPQAVQGAGLVLFCVKSGDTEAAGAQMRPYLGAGSLVLCLQNGVDNADRLRAVLGGAASVAAAVVYVASEMAGPGHLRHHGRGELVIEPGPGSEAAARALAAAGVPAEVSDDVHGALWFKLTLNCAYNAISAIAGQAYGTMVEGQGVRAVMEDAVRECQAVAAAEGVRLPGDVQAAVRALAASMPGQSSSTAHDLARGRPTEIDHLNGLVVRRGAALGIPTPVNRTLWALVKLMERRAG